MPFASLMPDKKIKPDELELYLEVMIKRLLKDKPHMANNPKMVNELIDESVKLLNERFIDAPKEMTIENLRDPNFIKQLAVSLTLTAELKQEPGLAKTLDNALDKLMKDPAFRKEFSELNPKDIEAPSKLDKLLDKFLNKEQKDMVKDALKKVNQFFDKKFGSGKDKKDSKDKPADQPDEFMNLYGLLNSKMTGTIMIPSCNSAIPPGVVGLSPNIGDAPIDKINNIRDTSHGDGLASNANAKQNLGKIAGNIVSTTMVNDINNDLEANGPKPRGNTPTLQKY